MNRRFQFREFTRRDREKNLRRCEAIIFYREKRKTRSANRLSCILAVDVQTAIRGIINLQLTAGLRLPLATRCARSAANSNRQLVNSFIAHRRQTHSYCMERHINSWRTHLQASGQVAEPKAKSFNNFCNFGYYYKLFHIFALCQSKFFNKFSLPPTLSLARSFSGWFAQRSVACRSPPTNECVLWWSRAERSALRFGGACIYVYNSNSL